VEVVVLNQGEDTTYLARAAGTARFAYNWALAEWKRQYEVHKQDSTQPVPTQQSLRRQLNAIKRGQFPWMLEVTKNPWLCVPRCQPVERKALASAARSK